MKHKCKISLYLITILLMIICSYLIGNYLVQPRNDKQINQNQIDLANNEKSFNYIGKKKSSDNPWGYNAGFIDTDEYGRVIFLTPDTSVETTFRNKAAKKLIIDYGLHSWVNINSTDGAEITMEIYSVNNVERKITKKLSVDSTDINEEVIDLSDINDGNLVVNILCNNGLKNNSNNDWVIINNLTIE